MADVLSSTMKKQSAAKPPLASKLDRTKVVDTKLDGKVKRNQPSQGGMSGLGYGNSGLGKSQSEPALKPLNASELNRIKR